MRRTGVSGAGVSGAGAWVAAAAAEGRAGARLCTADVDGPVHYAEYGAEHAGSGPTLVLVHGLGGCHQNWLPAAPLLARHARVLAVDLVGFGRTPEAGRGVGVEAQAAMLEGFLARVVRGPAVLVGNSLGGLVSLVVAARAPERVAGLVLVGPAQPPAPGRRVDPLGALRLLVHATPGLGEALLWWNGRRTGPRGLFVDLLTLGCADVRRVPRAVVEANVALVGERMEKLAWAHASSYLRGTRSLLAALLPRGRFDRWVAAVRAPTLLVHGRQDRLVDVRDSEHLARQRPDWTFVPMEDVGHVPQMETPSRFVSHLRAWLARDALRPAA
jgi:glycerol-3-phosphate dehydrogenase